MDGNVTTDSHYYGIGTNGSVSSGSTDSLSSVITVTLDGRELDSCGDTLIFTVQVEKEFGVRNLSCPAKVMDATSDLPDAGTYRCTVSDGRDGSALKDVTLIVTADNKVGLYDNQGKEMK